MVFEDLTLSRPVITKCYYALKICHGGIRVKMRFVNLNQFGHEKYMERVGKFPEQVIF